MRDLSVEVLTLMSNLEVAHSAVVRADRAKQIALREVEEAGAAFQRALDALGSYVAVPREPGDKS